MKRILFTVTNDLSYDQRMQRICSALADAGYECELIGRKLRDSKPLASLNFKQTRLKCWFNTGFAFYAEYNIRLFFYLLSRKFDAVCSIDLDSILPGYFASSMKGKTQIYDAHEYFSQMQEVVSRPCVHKVWLAIERFMMTRIKHCYTIGEGYAAIFKKEYNLDFDIIRNVPISLIERSAEKLEKSIVYQGAINVGRGLEEMIEAMTLLPDFKLVIIGNGPELEKLKQLSQHLNVINQVNFLGALLPNQLKKETSKHWLGLTLFSAIGEHHQLSLANRFFDYIQSHVPQIAMNYAEYAALNSEHDIAYLLQDLNAKSLAKLIKSIAEDPETYLAKKEHCASAANELCWENESKKLIEFYKNIL